MSRPLYARSKGSWYRFHRRVVGLLKFLEVVEERNLLPQLGLDIRIFQFAA
jgi:hypothetical protein